MDIARNPGIFILIIFPMIVYPILLLYGAEIETSRQQKLEKEVSLVAVENKNTLPELVKLLEEEKNIKITQGKKIDKNCNLIISIEKNQSFFEEQFDNYEVSLSYESTDNSSYKALERVSAILSDYKRELLYRRLDENNLSLEFTEPLKISSINTASKEKISGNMLGSLLPVLITVFIIMGAVQVATDTTAGEKERKTMQTLLLTPIKKTEILVTKLGVVATVAILSTITNFTSIALTLSFVSGKIPEFKNFMLSPATILYCSVIVLPLVMLISTLVLSLGIMAKNQIEASIYSTPIMLLSYAPFIVSSNNEFLSQTYLYFIPIINTSLLLKSVLMGITTYKFLAITFISNIAYTCILLIFTAKLFKNEDIAFGGITDIITQRTDKTELNPMDSILLFSISILLYFYIGSRLQENNLHIGLVCSQILFLLLPALIISKKTKLKKTFLLNKPPLYSIFIAPVIGLCTIIIASFIGQIQGIFTPAPDSMNKAIESLFSVGDFKSALIALSVMALTPAIFEELFFRGAIMRGFEKQIKGFWLCLLIGFLFAVFHLNIYNLLALTFVGAILTAFVIKTNSIIPVMIIHFVHNGVQVLLKDHPIMQTKLEWYIVTIAIIIVTLTLWLPKNRDKQAINQDKNLSADIHLS